MQPYSTINDLLYTYRFRAQSIILHYAYYLTHSFSRFLLSY